MSRHPQKLIHDCADHLALTVGELLSIASIAPKRYFVWEIPKRSGSGTRVVCHPARELKPVQNFFLHNVLSELPVHSAATAYVRGSSIRENATVHMHSRVVMKLDFTDFFNSLKFRDWWRYAGDKFPEWSKDEFEFSAQILFWGAGNRWPTCLAIGASTSPLLSNALMYEVDEKLSDYAVSAGLRYTRYADDITFSSEEWLDYDSTLDTVRKTLASARYTSVQLNQQKTILVSNDSARRVTGLLITPDNKISIGRDRKRLISAMVHRAYCRILPLDEQPKPAGLLAFALDVEPQFVERLRAKYSSDVVDLILRHKAADILSRPE